jgi:hypothetical protein
MSIIGNLSKKRFRWVAAFAAIAGVCLLIFLLNEWDDDAVDSWGHQSHTPRARCRAELRRIGSALRQYREVNGCYPPAFIADREGRPLHSWRTLLAPYMGYPLENYNFAEPWNGPNNIRVISVTYDDRYRCPASTAPEKSPFTNYVAVVGDRTAWSAQGQRSLDSGKVRQAELIMVVEVADSDIYWTEPRDLNIGTMSDIINGDRKGPSSNHWGGVNVLVWGGENGDSVNDFGKDCGHVLFVRNGTTPDAFKSMLTVREDRP